MSQVQSNLSSTGFDYVVAVTQDSINGALDEMLYAGQPEVVLCYAYDENDPPVPVPIDHDALVTAASGTDPFAVPAGTPGHDPRVQNLGNAGFAFAVKVKLGLPPGIPPASLPPIIALRPGQSNVTYTVTFAEFAVAEILYGPRNSTSWFSQAQPRGASWTFSGTVDLDFQDKDFSELKPAVQNRLKDIGDPGIFGVKQLFYDVNSSALVQGFEFNDLPANSALNGFMADNFVSTYFKSLNNAEILGYAAAQVADVAPASIPVTDVNFFVPAAVGDAGAPLTLNYLCAAGNDALPDTTHAGFGWNWIDPGAPGKPQESLLYDGVAALNRNALARYIGEAALPGVGSLSRYASGNCYLPSVTVSLDSASQVVYQFSASPGQPLTVNYPAAGGLLVAFSYRADSSDQAGLDGDLGRMEISTSYDLTVNIQNGEIVVDQHLVFWTSVRHLATTAAGNVVNKRIIDTYSVAVDDSGRLVVALKSTAGTDDSQRPGVDGFLDFWTNVNEYSDTVAAWAQALTAGHLTDVPVSFADNFVFPGAATFTFADAAFSENFDLVSHITYVSNL
jgi:hypothetical protein